MNLALKIASMLLEEGPKEFLARHNLGNWEQLLLNAGFKDLSGVIAHSETGGKALFYKVYEIGKTFLCVTVEHSPKPKVNPWSFEVVQSDGRILHPPLWWVQNKSVSGALRTLDALQRRFEYSSPKQIVAELNQLKQVFL